MARGAATLRPPPARTATWRPAAALALGILALGLVLRLAEPGRAAGLQNFILVFTSLLIEAFPFIVLGALVSAAIEVFVPARTFERLARLPRGLQMPAAAMAGFAFPVCECGSVPVARRLAAKGLSVPAAITFMLAAPILNPVVIASTVIAYRGRDILWPMVLGRAGLGLVAAMAVGWVVGARSAGDFLRPLPGAGGPIGDPPLRPEARRSAFFGHLAGDALFMGRYLVLGAAVAAGLQTFVPQTVLDGVATTPILSVVALMVLAFVLSLCSESDAFVAASFVQFGAGAQLAFLVFGPMVDTKLGFLYHGTFTRGFLRTVVLVVGAVTLAGALWIEVAVG